MKGQHFMRMMIDDVALLYYSIIDNHLYSLTVTTRIDFFLLVAVIISLYLRSRMEWTAYR